MVDWEMKAKQLAGELETTAAVLLIVGIVGLWHASGGWAIGWWCLVIWLAVAGIGGARIKS